MTEAELETWMDAYGEAFEQRDPDAAAALFTDDATYQWGPFGELLTGPAEIRRKWAESVEPEEDGVTFDYEVLAVTPEVGVTRWIASFSSSTLRKVTRYDGVFVVTLTEDGRCHQFREWWNTREEDLA